MALTDKSPQDKVRLHIEGEPTALLGDADGNVTDVLVNAIRFDSWTSVAWNRHSFRTGLQARPSGALPVCVPLSNPLSSTRHITIAEVAEILQGMLEMALPAAKAFVRIADGNFAEPPEDEF